MGLKEIAAKIKEKITNRPVEVYADNETRDKYLRSLRRERRIQMEKVEKERLKQQIEAFKKKEREKHLWGFRNNILRQKALNKRKIARQRWL